MPEDDPNDLNREQNTVEEEAAATAAAEEEFRSAALTTEQRRLLGGPRSLRGRARAKSSSEPELEPAPEAEAQPPPPKAEPEKKPEPAATPKPNSPVTITPRNSPRRERAQPAEPPPATPGEGPAEGERKPGRTAAALVPDKKSGRAVEMQRAALIIGALLLVGLTFYVGKKFEYWKYLLTTARNKPKLEVTAADRYPGLSAQQLVDQALTAEREHRWKDAADRFVAAKQKDLRYRGILFRLGKIALDVGDTVAADNWFERSVQFGENVDASEYFRGLIAIRREDFPAAERFMEAAAGTEPFNAYYQFYWGEALRMGRHPTEAIPHYERANALASSQAEHAIFEFKIRMARIESGQTQQVRAALEKAGQSGPLSLPWLMTKAALEIRSGKMAEAINLLREARADAHGGIFTSCAADNIFQQAAKQNSEVAELCKIESGELTAMP